MILSFSQQQTIKPISGSNENKYSQLTNEVESLEIDQLLGSQFYQAVAADPDSYDDLLNETEFTRADDTTIKHRGLRYVIAYLNYAKYVGDNYFDTFSGFTKKSTPDSEPISAGEIKRLKQENREIAFNAFILIKEYLDLNTDIYTLWNCTSNKRPKRQMFYGVKNTTL
jgi:hypothetical protein